MKSTIHNRMIAPTIRPQNKRFSVIIPAAGMGNRMKSYGPKALLDIGGTTILENQIRHINTYLPRSEIIVVAGFESKKIKQHIKSNKNLKIVENSNFETTNVVSSIGIGLKETTHKDVVVIYGDLVFNAYTLKVPFGSDSIVIIDKNGYMNPSEVGCIIENHMIETMMYDLPIKWGQIVSFCGKELELLRLICDNRKYDMYFGFEVINIIINAGGRFSAFQPRRMKIKDIDSSKDLREIEGILV